MREGPPQASDAGAALLARLRPAASIDLRRAYAANGVIALAVVAQAYWLAGFLHALIVEHRTPQRGALLLFVLVLLIRVGAGFLADRLAFRAGLKAVRVLRLDLLEKLTKAGPVALASRPSGEIVALLGEGARAIEPFFSRYLPARVHASTLPLLIFAAILPVDLISAAVFIVTAPLIPLFMVLIGKGAEALNVRQWGELQRLSGQFLDAIQGLPILRAFNAGARMTHAVADAAERYRLKTMAVLRIAFLSSLTLEFFATVSIAMLAVFIGFRLMWGQLPYFEGIFILLLAPEFYSPLRAMGAAYHARMEALGAAERLATLEQGWAAAQPVKSGTEVARFEAVSLRFDGVSLNYGEGRRALEPLSLDIPAGACVALVGESGAGKSSLLSLIMGFVSPSGGRLLVNGIPLTDITPQSWREHIAYVPQRPMLLEASVVDNIAMGGAVPDAARVRAAALKAGIAARIEALPQGYDTVIGDGGQGLSGGEVHRIALARALYRDSPLLLLDEPTAHLDAESSTQVREAIATAAKGRTVVMIVHRGELLALADTIVTLEAGRITRIERRNVGQAQELAP